jgi:hypothetical protein
MVRANRSLVATWKRGSPHCSFFRRTGKVQAVSDTRIAIPGTIANRGLWVLGLLLMGLIAAAWLHMRRRGKNQES